MSPVSGNPIGGGIVYLKLLRIDCWTIEAHGYFTMHC